MSGETYTVIAAEGVHDVETVSKILRLKGFDEVRYLNDVPAPLRVLIPKQYPTGSGNTELNRMVPHPSFLVRNGYWILLSSAGGETELAANMKELLTLPAMGYADSALRGAAILADADTKTAEEKKDVIFRQIVNAFSDSDDVAFSPSGPTQIELYEKARPFDIYIFPDNQAQGTLEDILIEGASKYVSYAKSLSYTALKSGSKEKKAIIGVIANALRPGRANQVTVRDDNWFTENSMASLSSHSSLSLFIDSIINWNAV